MNLLMYAVIHNKAKIVYLLLQLNVDVNIQDNVRKFTPIMHSITMNKSPLISKMLLDHGVDLSLRDAVEK